MTERDLDLLTMVGLAGYASTEQVARDLFPSLDRCRRRVRDLFDAGFVKVTLYDSRKTNLVSLTARGLALLEKQRPALEDRVRRAGAIHVAGIDHHLGVVDARLYAAALGEKRGAPLMCWSNAGGELIRELGLDAWHLVPDGVAEFATPTGRVFIAIEIDCGTEPGSVLQGKLERYAVVATASVVDALWIVVSAGTGRRRSLEKLRDAAGLGAWARVIDRAALLVRPVAEPDAEVGGAVRAGGPNTLAREHQVRESNHGVPTPTPATEGRVDRWADRTPGSGRVGEERGTR